jgi:hypothetical protein
VNLKATEKILGNGLLQDGPFGDEIRKHFPDATKLDLYGAGVTFNADGVIVSVTCQGRTVRLDAASSEPKNG